MLLLQEFSAGAGVPHLWSILCWRGWALHNPLTKGWVATLQMNGGKQLKPERESIFFCILTAIKVCRQLLPEPCSAGTTWNVQQTCNAEHELQYCVCSRPIISELPEMISLQAWRDQSCSLQPRSDFISVQFHLWALNLEAEWSNSPNFLVGIALTADFRHRGYLKQALGNVSRCRRHELKD